MYCGMMGGMMGGGLFGNGAIWGVSLVDWGLGLVGLLIVLILVLALAALVRHLFGGRGRSVDRGAPAAPAAPPRAGP